MKRAAYYATFLRRHPAWTPADVDNLPADVEPFLLMVELKMEEWFDGGD